MKIILFILSFLLLGSIVYSQGTIDLDVYREFTSKLDIRSMDIRSANALTLTETQYAAGPEFDLGNEMIRVKPGQVFKTLKKQDNLYVIQLLEQDRDVQKFYALTDIQIRNHSKLYEGDRPKSGLVSSAITIPVKIRFGDGDTDNENKKYFNFEGNYNIGITVGWRDRITKSGKLYLSYLGGLNIGPTRITAETTNNAISSETNASVLSPFLGLLLEFNDFQVGAFSGWDHIGGKIGKSWDYQGNIWLGFGIGYNIFTSKDTRTQ